MNEEISKQTIIDNEHINLLSQFHLISGILTLAYTALMAVNFGFINFIFNIGDIFNTAESSLDIDFPFEFVIYYGFWSVCFLVAILLGIAKIFSSKYLKQRKKRTFCFAISCIECLSIPYGAILGVFSIIVLNRSSVKNIFHDQKEQIV